MQQIKYNVDDKVYMRDLKGQYAIYNDRIAVIVQGRGFRTLRFDDGSTSNVLSYEARMDDGTILIVQERLVNRYPKLNRKDMDVKVSWAECPWMTFPDKTTPQ